MPVPAALPSPKFHENVYGLVPPLTVAVNVVAVPGVTEVGVQVKSVVNARALIVIVADALKVCEFADVTVTLIV